MNVQLDDGETITITTPQGAIVINTDGETRATLVTVAYSEGHQLSPRMVRNIQSGRESAQVWIEPEKRS